MLKIDILFETFKLQIELIYNYNFESFQLPAAGVTDKMMSLRHLWALHLLPLTHPLLTMIETLVPSMCLAIQQMLRRTLAQFIDLAPSLSINIAK